MSKKKRKLKKGVAIKFFILISFVFFSVFFIYLFLSGNNKIEKKEFSKEFDFLNSKVSVKLYIQDEENSNKIFNEVEKIVKHYDEISNKDKAYDGINNIYKINNTANTEKLTIDKDLYEMIKYSVNWYYNNGEIVNINIGNLEALWKKYVDAKEGAPSIEEIRSISNLDMKNIVLYPDNQILTGSVNLNIDNVATGYMMENLKKYFESISFDNYFISYNNVYLVGIDSKDDKYQLNVKNPDDSSKNINDGKSDVTFKISNKYISTVGSYDSYNLDVNRYHSIIDIRTKLPASYMKSVTVICDDAILAQSLAKSLFLISIDEGKEYIKNFNNVEVMWYSNEDEVSYTNGLKKYF